MDLEKSEKILTEILGLKRHFIVVKFFACPAAAWALGFKEPPITSIVR